VAGDGEASEEPEARRTVSIDKRPNGKYRARVREYPGGPERTRLFEFKRDAEEWEAETRVALKRGSYLTADELSVTIGSYVVTHVSRQIWRGRTIEVATRALAIAEAHFGASRPLTAIRRGDVETFVVKLSKRFAPNTVRTMFQHFRTLMRSAMADGYLVVDPTLKIKLPKSSSELVVLEPSEIHALIAAAPPEFRAAIILGAFVGLRVGEAQGLAVSDIDFLRRTVNVRRQLDGRSQEMTLGPPKTSASSRSIPVPSDVLDMLAAHVQRFGPGRDGVVLHHKGDYMSDNAFNWQWRLAQVAAGRVAGSLRYHWLRHAFASSLISAGCSVKAVADAMGHQNPTVTLTTYASLWPGDEDRIRAALESSWRTADSLRTADMVNGR
jgi:integrase